MSVSISKIIEIMKTGDKDGFTISLKGITKRYVVAFTHNESVTPYYIAGQLEACDSRYSQINIGGWTDTKTSIQYIDLSTSFDDLRQAIEFGKDFKQIAIWDNKEFKEIRL